MFDSWIIQENIMYADNVFLQIQEIFGVFGESIYVPVRFFQQFLPPSVLIVFFVESYIRIGMNDLAEVGVYVWDDGSPVTHLRFSPGEPNYLTQSCMLMWNGDGGFADGPCDGLETFFICKTDYNKLFSQGLAKPITFQQSQSILISKANIISPFLH